MYLMIIIIIIMFMMMMIIIIIIIIQSINLSINSIPSTYLKISNVHNVFLFLVQQT